ncbi:MAG: hypothetical protein LBC03_05585 [Nitrososphaerota archaeon]|jgi:DNA-directed RNA polymerase subunit RPC12/RpoP|nr:hypothetical protein [Nitrososphaerota archaeon]
MANDYVCVKCGKVINPFDFPQLQNGEGNYCDGDSEVIKCPHCGVHLHVTVNVAISFFIEEYEED